MELLFETVEQLFVEGLSVFNLDSLFKVCLEFFDYCFSFFNVI